LKQQQRLLHVSRHHYCSPTTSDPQQLIDDNDTTSSATPASALGQGPRITLEQLTSSDMDKEMRQKYGPLYDEQVELEQEAVERCVERYTQELKGLVEMGRAAEVGANNQLLLKWYQPLVRLIEDEIFIKYGAMERPGDNTDTATTASSSSSKGGKQTKQSQKQKQKQESLQQQQQPATSSSSASTSPAASPPSPPLPPPEHIPYMTMLSPEKLAVIAVHDVIGMVLKSRSGVQYRGVVSAIGDAVQTEANFHKLRVQKEIEVAHRKMMAATGGITASSATDATTTSATNDDSTVTVTATATTSTTPDNNTDANTTTAAAETAATTDNSASAKITPDNKMSTGRTRQLVHNDIKATRGNLTARNINALAIRKQINEPFWSPKIRMQIGGTLVELLLRVAKYTIKHANGVQEEVFALEHAVGSSRSSKSSRSPMSTSASSSSSSSPSPALRKVIRMHPMVFDQVDVNMLMRDAMHVRYYPMLVPPLPWTAPERGGYYKNNSPMIRYHSYAEQVKPMIDRQEELGIVYGALNALGATAWRINPHVYKVAREIWEEGGGSAEIPDRRDLPIPLPLVQGEGRSTSWFRQMKAIDRHNSNLHSLRCDFILKLDVAERFKDRIVYFPHNMDFRGRVYPIPPHLNHMGGDFNRGMLLFANGKPLGERGLYWLKIHLANLCGKDKATFEDRIAFVEQHLAEITDSATRPLEGKRWWLHTDDPFQCLAACCELHEALQHPNPAEFISHLPIHQDGTCNGLQHYAALGLDAAGARSVNLLPSIKPQDVYSDVASLVQARIAHDAQLGVPMAQLLNGRVDRKIVKQTVMTSVYGVTFIGARQQINNALKDRGIIPEEQMYEASTYIAKKTFDSIREMFTGAKGIMEWLAECATLIARKGRLVSWVTPLGLPVVQHYRQPTRTQVVQTALQQITLPQEEGAVPVNKRQQRSAFPPNFVHSLDSSHMLLTALMCENRGVAYASVHDSFWTHACTIDDMNSILREAFVQLHRRPVLQQLRDDFIRQHPDIKFPPLPVESGVEFSQAPSQTVTQLESAVAESTPASPSSVSSHQRFEISQVRKSPYFFN
jgi:DNA-directed RNA polymerase